MGRAWPAQEQALPWAASYGGGQFHRNLSFQKNVVFKRRMLGAILVASVACNQDLCSEYG